jgi:hypothetical protein
MADCHGKCSIPSVEIGQVWSYCRDNLKGTTPLAQEQILHLQRDYLAPSKAHIKRLTRKRVLIRRASPNVPEPSRKVAHHNEARRLGERVKLMTLRSAYGQTSHLDAPPAKRAPVEFDYTRNATVPKDERVGTYDDFAAKADEQARWFAAERARLDAMKG